MPNVGPVSLFLIQALKIDLWRDLILLTTKTYNRKRGSLLMLPLKSVSHISTCDVVRIVVALEIAAFHVREGEVSREGAYAVRVYASSSHHKLNLHVDALTIRRALIGLLSLCRSTRCHRKYQIHSHDLLENQKMVQKWN